MKLYQRYLFFSGVVAVASALALWATTHWPLYLCWLGTTSAVLFALYGYDKAQAMSKNRRVPEKTLHMLTLAGGFLGGIIGRVLFRHKTLKWQFTLVTFLSTVLHGYIIYTLELHRFLMEL